MAVIIPKVNTHPSLFPRMDDTMIAGSPAKKAPKHNVRISRNDMWLPRKGLVFDAVRLVGG
jgi:hypothetical protein